MPLDFSFTEEQNLFRRTIREFAEKELAPKALHWDRANEWPKESLEKMARQGLLGMLIPERDGGQGADWVTTGICIEETARADPQCTLVAASHTINERFLYEHGSSKIKEEWIPSLAKGKKLIGIALTEPGCGSDAAALTTKAVEDKGGYVLDGEKSNITGAAPGGCDAYIIFARTGPEELRHRAISAFFLDLDRPGVERYELQAMARGNNFGGIRLSGVRIPAENLLGEKNKGFYIAMGVVDMLRVLVVILTLGAAQSALDLAIKYVKERKAFGRPIGKFEGTQFIIAEDHTLIEAARMLAYRTLWMKDEGMTQELPKWIAMAKWYGVQTSLKTIDDAITLHGAVAYTSEYPLEYLYRATKGLDIGDGTPQIMKLIIARELLGREFLPYR